jgi:hypothetical protein
VNRRRAGARKTHNTSNEWERGEVLWVWSVFGNPLSQWIGDIPILRVCGHELCSATPQR